MLAASILAAVPDDGTGSIPHAIAALSAVAGVVGLYVAAPPADPLTRCLKRLRVRELTAAPAALDTALRSRGLAPVRPWMVASWLDGASVPEVPPALTALHLGGRDGGRVLLRLTRGR